MLKNRFLVYAKERIQECTKQAEQMVNLLKEIGQYTPKVVGMGRPREDKLLRRTQGLKNVLPAK